MAILAPEVSLSFSIHQVVPREEREQFWVVALGWLPSLGSPYYLKRLGSGAASEGWRGSLGFPSKPPQEGKQMVKETRGIHLESPSTRTCFARAP